MARGSFWLIGGCFAIVCILGCVGQNVEGAWRGPFPLQGASDCVVQIWPDRRFELSCAERRWVGAGRWDRVDGRLKLSFGLLTRQGRIQPQPLPSYDLSIDGRGNSMCLHSRDTGTLCWARTLR